MPISAAASSTTGVLNEVTVDPLLLEQFKDQATDRLLLFALKEYEDQGCREDWGGPGQIQKVGAHKMDCVRGVWGRAPRKF